MNGTKDNWWKAVIVVILIMGVFNLAVTLDLYGKANSRNETLVQNASTCDGIPIQFLIEEPVCAQELLDVLNRTALRVDPNNATSIDNEIQRQTEYWVEKYILWHTRNE
ncbi:MAG: hypothetical protein WC975_00650 [Phycisphaerae bacterium]